MKDILERLREHLKYVCWMGHDEEQVDLLRDAMKEIRSLREQNEMLRKSVRKVESAVGNIRAELLAMSLADAVVEERWDNE